MPPQSLQVQHYRSDFTNARMPSFSIASRFSIMLMQYFLWYRSSQYSNGPRTSTKIQSRSGTGRIAGNCNMKKRRNRQEHDHEHGWESGVPDY